MNVPISEPAVLETKALLAGALGRSQAEQVDGRADAVDPLLLLVELRCPRDVVHRARARDARLVRSGLVLDPAAALGAARVPAAALALEAERLEERLRPQLGVPRIGAHSLEALEREHPLSPGQTTGETYLIAAGRMAKALRASVTPPLFAVGVFGMALALYQGTRVRAWRWSPNPCVPTGLNRPVAVICSVISQRNDLKPASR